MLFYTQQLLKSVSIWQFMVLISNSSVFVIRFMMASSYDANIGRHSTSEVFSPVSCTASCFFSAIYTEFSTIKRKKMCHTQHHGIELFGAINLGFSVLKWNDICHTQHHGTELYWKFLWDITRKNQIMRIIYCIWWWTFFCAKVCSYFTSEMLFFKIIYNIMILIFWAYLWGIVHTKIKQYLSCTESWFCTLFVILILNSKKWYTSYTASWYQAFLKFFVGYL